MPIKDIFRLVFVIFSLYLMGDAFYHWDGFSYYASFTEFLPSVSLAFILWSIISFITAVIFWTAFSLLRKVLRASGTNIEFDQILLYAGFFLIAGIVSWKIKKVFWPDVQTTLITKGAVFVIVTLLSGIVAWLFRSKAHQWGQRTQERITPLVWLFGIFFVLSIPVVSYHAWFKNTSALPVIEEISGFNNDQSKPNIILVTFDALSARNMSAYGYQRDTTPFIEKWAQNAVLFANAEASSNFTTPSVASLMTGKRVWTHQTYHIEGSIPVKSNIESLPAELKKHGYYNMAFVVNPFASVRILGMEKSFDAAPLASELATSASLFGWKFGVVDKLLYKAFGERIRFHNWIFSTEFIFSRVLNLISRNIYQTTVPPEKTFNLFLNSIDHNVQKPFFAWIHLFPPHDPYLPPEPFKGHYSASSYFRAYKEQERLIEESYKYLFQAQLYPNEMQEPVDVMRDHYDEFIKYVDWTFEDFINELNQKHLENTVIILSADHGESFEHGYITHGGPFLYEQVTHVPLIIKEPGKAKGQVVNDRVELIDIPATILEMANIEVPSWMEGRSLVPLMRGDKLPARPVFSMNFQENRSLGYKITKGTVAVWDGDYKLIHYLDNGESLLFNLKHDPDEINNLFEKDTETRQNLLAIIHENLEKSNKKIKKTYDK